MTVLIDLDVVSDDGPARTPGPGPRRLVAAAACLLLAGGLLGASALPVRQRLPEARVPMGPSDTYFVAGDLLYIVGPETDAYTTLPRTVTAFTAPGGEWRWRHSLDLDGPITGLRVAGDVLMASSGTRPDDQRLLAMDAGTAAPLWERPGSSPMFAGAESLLFLMDGGVDGEPVGWERVRTSTGERLSRREFPSGTNLQPMSQWDDTDQRLLVTLPSGRVEIWDTAPDRMLNSADLPPYDGPSSYGSVGLAMVSTGVGITLVGYSMPDLRQTWTRQFGHELGIQACGEVVVCAIVETRLTALAPATGEVLWENGTYDSILSIGPMLFVDRRANAAGSGLVAVDPWTGETLRDFGPWTLARYEPGLDPDRTVVTQTNATGTAVLVAELDLRALTLRVIGLVQGVGEGCHAEGTVLFCRTLDGAAGMWDLPIAP